jgi:P450-derived glycosyltransferase activator
MPTHQIEPRSYSDAELIRHLSTVRGVQWARGVFGDPYALMLRARPADPARLFSSVREGGPVRRSLIGALVTGEHATARTVLADRRLGARPPAPHADERLCYQLGSPLPLHHILFLDNAFLDLSHAGYDRLTARAPRLDDRDLVTRVADEVLSGLGGGFDLMVDFARPVAAGVAGRLVGWPEDELGRFTELCADSAMALDAVVCPPTLADTRRLATSVDALHARFTDLVGAGDELAAAMVTTVAGVEVAANMICNTMLCLFEHTELRSLLRGEPELAGRAVEEALRLCPPVRLESRIAQEDLELGGHPVEAGEQVVVLVDAANRDPAVYDEPDRYVLTRDAGHLSLTGGLASSFVAPLARRLAAEAVRLLMAWFPDARPAGATVRRNRSPVVRGIARCPVAAGSFE